MSDVASILKAARERYASAPSHAPYGFSAGAGYCVCTALDSALDLDEAGHYALGKVAGLRLADPRAELIVWNAAHSTEDVLAAFDRAIAKAEAS